MRRLHLATIWGSLLVMAALGSLLLVVGTNAGQAMVDVLATLG